MNRCFTVGKMFDVENCHAAWRHQKTTVCTSIVYGVLLHGATPVHDDAFSIEVSFSLMLPTLVIALPSAPTLHLESATSDSVSVGWTNVDAGNSEIKRFVINFKKTLGGLWEERTAGKHVTSFTLAPLACGTAYQVGTDREHQSSFRHL
jgi:hypothetical protein